MSELSLQKRRSGVISGAEQITGVKNAQAEMLLARRLHQYRVKFRKRQQDIQLEEYQLENEAKLLNLDSKQSDLEYKRRITPHADLSHEEMIINNLQKYLVQNSQHLCYTDKSLGAKIRGQSLTESVSPLVAQARDILTKKEILKNLEKSRKEMYSFLEQPKSSQAKREAAAAFEDSDSDMDEFEIAMKANKLPGFDNQVAQDTNRKKAKPEGITLPAVGEINQTIHKPSYHNDKSIREKLKENPLYQEALETHRSEKGKEEPTRPVKTPGSILSRMARKQPLTKTQMKEEIDQVNSQVDKFCQKIEEVLWQYKEEEFQQSLKFVKDKDGEWNRFMEKMQKRTRANIQDDDELPDVMKKSKQDYRPSTGYRNPVLTEKEKKELIMKNLLIGKPRLIESAPVRRKGIPFRTAERSQNHSPTAKLRRIIEQSKAAEKKPEKPNSALAVANLQSAAAAL